MANGTIKMEKFADIFVEATMTTSKFGDWDWPAYLMEEEENEGEGGTKGFAVSSLTCAH